MSLLGARRMEHPLEQLGPRDAGWRRRRECLALSVWRVSGVGRRARDNRGTQFGIGREHAMEWYGRLPPLNVEDELSTAPVHLW